MKRAASLAVVLLLAASACGGGGGSTDPASANSCEELADVGINILQEAIDATGEMSVSDFIDAGETGEVPEAIQRLDTLGSRMDDRAAELGCSEEEGQRLMCERIGRLQAGTPVGQLLLAGIGAEC